MSDSDYILFVHKLEKQQNFEAFSSRIFHKWNGEFK